MDIIKSEFEQEYDDDYVYTETNNIKPFDTSSIKISNYNMSMQSMINRLKFDEIDLNPEFQRNPGLWNKKKMSRLIESVLLRLPLPIFYFDVADPDKWVVIDGLQRLSAIKQFIVENDGNGFPLRNLEFLKELEGKRYKDLNRKYIRTIDETEIVTYQMEPQTPKEVRYSIFNRINTGGLTLNSQEIRQALNQAGRGVSFLKEIVETSEFKDTVLINSQRMSDRELVLRYITFYTNSYKNIDKIGNGVTEALDRTMEMIDDPNYPNHSFLDIKKSFIDSLAYLNRVFETEYLFNKKLVDPKKMGTINRSLFEIWTVTVSKLDSEEKEYILNNKIEFIEGYKELLGSNDFEDAITKGTNSKKAVITRFNQLEAFIADFLKEIRDDQSDRIN